MGEKPTVLVVDDDRDVRESVAAVLEDAGYDVELAENGAQALACLRRGRPDLMVLDLMMPIMSGWEVLEVLREEPELGDVHVLVLSAVRAPGGLPRLEKPMRLDELLTSVQRLSAH
jgi:CheY-like chemotaxis protein